MCTLFQVEKKNDEENIKLHVPVSVRGDTGKYTVTLKNDHGEDQGDINVIVLGKVPKNIEVSKIEKYCGLLFRRESKYYAQTIIVLVFLNEFVCYGLNVY